MSLPQAAEKALKAILASNGETIPKTHDLRLLIERCVALDRSMEPLRNACDELPPYATEFRYPTDIPDPPISEVENAIALAREIVSSASMALTNRFPDQR
ncbi:nucleotidyltransferase [Parazoarcus communis]|uniref:Nucleotidyltransferase n=1 Tax=Parazoarcus communis TaxID=41977 RepID=A0A2U8H2D0_9RHOO|nr:nucleotidyltransferase [Parazoarcus communis]